MSEIGQDSPWGETFLTERVLYRSISGADPADPVTGRAVDHVDIPLVNTLARMFESPTKPSGVGEPEYNGVRRAWNAQMFLYGSIDVATDDPEFELAVYTWGGTAFSPYYPTNQPDYSAAAAANLKGAWVLVDTFTVTPTGLFMPLRNITPSYIRVICTGLSLGTGTLALVEQHSA